MRLISRGEWGFVHIVTCWPTWHLPLLLVLVATATAGVTWEPFRYFGVVHQGLHKISITWLIWDRQIKKETGIWKVSPIQKLNKIWCLLNRPEKERKTLEQFVPRQGFVSSLSLLFAQQMALVKRLLFFSIFPLWCTLIWLWLVGSVIVWVLSLSGWFYFFQTVAKGSHIKNRNKHKRVCNIFWR